MPYLNHTEFAKVHETLELARGGPFVSQKLTEALDKALGHTTKAIANVASPGLRELAHDFYGIDEVKIDDEGVGTSASPGEGTWVQAWVWLSHDELVSAGLETDEDDHGED